MGYIKNKIMMVGLKNKNKFKKAQLSGLAGNKFVLLLLTLIFIIIVLIWIAGIRGNISEVIGRFFS